MKVAFDQNIPPVMVRVFQTFADTSHFRKLSQGLEIKSAREYTPKHTDSDYLRKNDVPWIRRFAADGGKVIISGDTRMQSRPHEKKALLEEGLVVVFFESRWSDWNFFHKSALLLHWWPVIATRVKSARPATFWHVPLHWKDKGKLRAISTEDLKKQKIDRQLKARPRVQKERQKKRESVYIEIKESAQTEFQWPQQQPRASDEQPKKEAE